MEPIIQNLTWSKLIHLFASAKERIVIILPAIHEEWVEVISGFHESKNLELWICIDNQENVFRSGYGHIDSIYRLKEMNATVKQCKNLRFGFLGIDDSGWSLHLESRIISGSPEGPNALLLSEEMSQQIIQTFFPEKFFISAPQGFDLTVEDLNEDQLDWVHHTLVINPPAEPDLQRQISTYQTLFQFVELSFEGGNLSSKTVTIPSKALPFKNAELKERLKTRLNLFTKEITEQWEELAEIKQQIEGIRKMHLVPCQLRKDKSILKKESKEEFQTAVTDLREVVNENLKKLQNKLQTAINSSEDTLKNELTTFFQSNPPDSMKDLSAENAGRQLEREIGYILSKIKLPSADDLIKNVKIQVHYYELTIEDLSDQEFIKWFYKKGLITHDDENALAKFARAYQIKK